MCPPQQEESESDCTEIGIGMRIDVEHLFNCCSCSKSMGFREIISESTGIEGNKIPDGYQVIGNIMLLKFLTRMDVPAPISKAKKTVIAKSCLDNFPNIETVCEIKGVKGELRQPKTGFLASRLSKPTFETIHKESSLEYKLDVSKIMFSKGNLNERQRLIGMIQKSEVIVDMFAGIGYFSLGLAKFSPALRIYSIEKNPVSFRYLKENIRLNKIDNVMVKKGDCRKIKLREKADRVIMGYFPNTGKFLPYALDFLKEKGVIHYHNLYHEIDLWSKPLKEIEKALEKRRFRLTSIMGQNFVKSYAPGIWHVCLDFSVERIDA